MAADSPAFVSSFEEAWERFVGGGPLASMSAWREQLTLGRAQFLSFQVPLEATTASDELAAIQSDLADIKGIAWFEPEMLHVSLRGIGFQVISKRRHDDVTREDVGRVSKQAAGLLRGARRSTMEIGPINAFHDALILEVRDDGSLADLRRRLGDAIPDAFGIPDDRFLPHITIAMFVDPEVAGSGLRIRLPSLRQRPRVTAGLSRVELARWWFTGQEDDYPERDPVRTYKLR